jgi:5'-nucleotidase
VIAGDFLNPSASNSARFKGKPLNGRHMVDTLNGFLDLAAFGNHEFDLDEADFRARLRESRFDWVSSNATDARSGAPFPGAPAFPSQKLRGPPGVSCAAFAPVH